MKIAIISDAHLGFSINPKTENDSFEAFREAVEKSLDCDIIILGGDLFDSRSPKTHVWGKALEILSIPLLQPSSNVKLVYTDKKLKEISKATLSHIPVIAIHGNHELKSKDEINAVEALENAGVLIYLKRNKITFEKDGVILTIYAMSYVPERYARQALESWSPKPMENGYNLLLLHQNIDPFVYSPLEPPTLDLSSLPKGFDVIVDGHIHITTEKNLNGTKFIIPGSTIPTQYQPSEAEVPKGFYKIEFSKDGEMKTEFIKLESVRKFFYVNVEVRENGVEQIERKIREILFKSYEKEPVIRVKILGRSDAISEQDLRLLEKKYSSSAILLFSKSLESPELTQKIELLRSLKEKKLSLEEIGMQILKKNLDELGFGSSFNWADLFRLLSAGDVDTALKIVLGEQSTITRFMK